jgi:hypothetical protein
MAALNWSRSWQQPRQTHANLSQPFVEDLQAALEQFKLIAADMDAD